MLGSRTVLLSVACWLATVALTTGCRPSPPAPRRPSVEVGPCDERLHDICGHLLAYYSAHKKLPPSLGDLGSASPLPHTPLVCPASGKPYVYDPRGLVISGRPGRLVLYDPEPRHSGMRGGILVGKPVAGGLITANFILVSEEEFASARRKAGPRG